MRDVDTTPPAAHRSQETTSTGGRSGGPAGPRVLVVDQAFREDGATRLVLRLLERWSAAGSRVEVFVLEPPLPGDLAPVPTPGIPVLHPPRGPGGRHPLAQLLRLLLGLLALLRPVRHADVVLAAREVDRGLLLGRVAALLVRRPFVVLVQSDPRQALAHHTHPRLRPAVRWCLRSAERVVCVSSGLEPALLELGVAGSRITVVPNGVDVDAVLAAGRRPVRSLPPGEGPLVVGLGRLVRQKGFDLLIRAHARVVADGEPHRLLLLGQGGDRERLLRLADDLGVAASVSLPGFSRDPLPILAAADLYCLPSRWEGQPLTLAEALVLGTPVVAADCVAGPRWLLADGAHGDLVPVDDVGALAAAVRGHLQQPARLRQAAAKGQVWARANLSERRAAEHLLAVLGAEAAARPARPARRSGRTPGPTG